MSKKLLLKLILLLIHNTSIITSDHTSHTQDTLTQFIAQEKTKVKYYGYEKINGCLLGCLTALPGIYLCSLNLFRHSLRHQEFLGIIFVILNVINGYFLYDIVTQYFQIHSPCKKIKTHIFYKYKFFSSVIAFLFNKLSVLRFFQQNNKNKKIKLKLILLFQCSALLFQCLGAIKNFADRN